MFSCHEYHTISATALFGYLGLDGLPLGFPFGDNVANVLRPMIVEGTWAGSWVVVVATKTGKIGVDNRSDILLGVVSFAKSTKILAPSPT